MILLLNSSPIDPNSIAQVSHDGTPAWVRYLGASNTRVTNDGHLVLDIRDALDESKGKAALRQWAATHRFSLEGLELRDAFYSLYFASIYPALAELPSGSPLLPAVAATLQRRKTNLDFRVRVHVDYAIQKLVMDFDGPFGEDTDDEFYAAISHRLGATYSPGSAPTPAENRG
ncbi:hypothetical protein [Microbacterium sp. RU33B]|uniref:hypothetical protein n=1 Tax=Microbacterium sp. RU33B TaxID=1907390 RepID=UPI00117D490C|nr:hypothetical protein [Microbacterium sp. RU33B]